MWSNPQETADLVTFTEEILNGKRNFCAVLHFVANLKRFKTSPSKNINFTAYPNSRNDVFKTTILDEWRHED